MNVIRADSYQVIIKDDMNAATKMLSVISKLGISLLAYKSISMVGKKTVFTLFALRNKEMAEAIRNEGFEAMGPFPGLFVHGDDVPGALADIFKKLAQAGFVVKASSGIANINKGYGVVLQVGEKDTERAFAVLGGE